MNALELLALAQARGETKNLSQREREARCAELAWWLRRQIDGAKGISLDGCERIARSAVDGKIPLHLLAELVSLVRALVANKHGRAAWQHLVHGFRLLQNGEDAIAGLRAWHEERLRLRAWRKALRQFAFEMEGAHEGATIGGRLVKRATQATINDPDGLMYGLLVEHLDGSDEYVEYHAADGHLAFHSRADQ